MVNYSPQSEADFVPVRFLVAVNRTPRAVTSKFASTAALPLLLRTPIGGYECSDDLHEEADRLVQSLALSTLPGTARLRGRDMPIPPKLHSLY